MCGIAGEFRFDGERPTLETLQSINDMQKCRGPDDEGIVNDGEFAFAHTRLSIIDLSKRSSQPMTDSDNGLAITYNGEVYNYREVRKKLAKNGHTFKSDGDAEVVLKGYAQWGPRVLSNLNGMFAFAIYDFRKKRLFMARDRLGIKPLYYHINGDRLRFASTLPALLEYDDIKPEVNREALNYYLTFHSVVPAPHTIIEGIRKLPNASHMLVCKDGSHEVKRYWSLEYNRKKYEPSDVEACKKALHKLLAKSVKRRMVSDVPVGVLLSGGLDSSLITGMLSKKGQKGLKTFSIGFEDVEGEKGNEFMYSDIIAEEFGTDHTKIQVKSDKALSHMRPCVKAMSEPMVSHDVIGFYLLSEEVSKHVKVVQSGQGADEIFAGYHWYPPLAETINPVQDYGRLFFDRDFTEYKQTVDESMVEADYATQFLESHFSKKGADRNIDKVFRLDTEVMLVEDPVKRVDNMTMAWGLEARVPFLDHEVVEFSARLPPQLKLMDGGKGILKALARDVIPSEVIDRPKGYFPVPGLKYVRGEYLDYILEVLSDSNVRDRGIYQPAYLKNILKDPDKHITPLRGSKLWQMAVLELWMQAHIDGLSK
ncbi:MAG: N-acetylglutaminylglutamine amidotransferase [Candidatus Altiarchaeales archaeon]|nr:N-acetylglutaminylglutamine amidotransferase [Candidatus Altiarchaeales archaeon]MBD3417330.1 N-acetylglutaminylglutamine amidotransferase [Candidatus Altiarchaeales archaeon]